MSSFHNDVSRDKPNLNGSTRFYSSRVARLIRILYRSDYRIATVPHSFFIRPRLRLVFDTGNRSVEHINEVEDTRWGRLVDDKTEVVSPQGIPINVDPVFYPDILLMSY